MSESIFSFLKHDDNFQKMYRKSLELEKDIYNGNYETALYQCRYIIENSIRVILVNIECDNQLSKQLLNSKKRISLSEKLTKCKNNNYISQFFLNKLKDFIRDFANIGAHDNPKKFKQADLEDAHKLIFDYVVYVFNKELINERYTRDLVYKFDLSYLDENSEYTEDEITSMVLDISGNEVFANDIIELSKSKYLIKDHVIPILKESKINVGEDLNEFFTMEKLEEILDDSDKSLINNQLNAYQNAQFEKINEFLADFKGELITISQINEMMEENDDKHLSLIKYIASDIIKNHLSLILSEINGIASENDTQYEINENDDSFDLKEIEKILGIPDKCPKCQTVLRPGALSCHNCGYDLLPVINQRCPECGKRIPIGADVCPKCGHDLKKYVCKRCGFENQAGSKFCSKCGKELIF